MKGLDKCPWEKRHFGESSGKADEGGDQVGALAILIIRKDLHKRDEGENGQIQSWHAKVNSQGSELDNLKRM